MLNEQRAQVRLTQEQEDEASPEASGKGRGFSSLSDEERRELAARGGAAPHSSEATSKRGFASMSEAKKREIAAKGGRSAHALGTAHKWTSEEAQDAGRKGGAISRKRPKNKTSDQE